MTTLKECRDEIKELIAENLLSASSKAFLPEGINETTITVMPGSPYIRQAETFGQKTVKYKALILINPTNNEKETDTLDAIIGNTVIDLEASNWVFIEGDEPAIRTLGDTAYLSSEITIEADIVLTRQSLGNEQEEG